MGNEGGCDRSSERVPSCVGSNGRYTYEHSPIYGSAGKVPKQGVRAMPWWSWRAGHADTSSENGSSSAVATATSEGDTTDADATVRPVDFDRLSHALDA